MDVPDQSAADYIVEMSQYFIETQIGHTNI